MSDTRENRQFGKRPANTIVISSNGKVREFKFRSGMLVAAVSVFTMFMVGYISATAYLAFREDIVTASFKQNARMKQAYEDRIAALRSKVDRITSRQLLDQQAVEAKVAALMKQQELLSGQTGELNGLFERARKNGIVGQQPPSPKGEQKAELEIDTTITGSIDLGDNALFAGAGSFLRGSAVGQASGEKIALAGTFAQKATGKQARLFDNVLDQINEIANRQRLAVVALQRETHEKAGKVAGVFAKLKVGLPDDLQQNVGGPYEPDTNVAFDDLTEGLANSLETLETLKRKTAHLPIGNPVPGAAVSSSFGSRVDPFHRRTAFHSGIDFRAKTGTPVKASGSGVVVHAGRKGGYGLMVEIDHGHGITTRYAHLSRILVKKGARVGKGKKIGKVGSTGRSTGPHLHYEVRRSDKASNPIRFLKAGRELKDVL